MTELHFGYNTNGFAHHRLEDTLTILHKLGYDYVALTLDYHVLNPFDTDWVGPRGRWRVIRAMVESLRLRPIIETGARFLLDPWRKHHPTLLCSPRLRQRRLDFLKRSCDLARRIGCDLVSFWSGSAPRGLSRKTLQRRCISGCRELSDYAADHGVRLGFEPEPGMFIDTMESFAELYHAVRHPAFGLTLDIGHVHCQGDGPIEEVIGRWRDVLWNVHIEDMKLGVHEHLMFGEGEIEFGPVLAALVEVNYSGGVCVELSRHSHDAVNTARKALAFLKSQRVAAGRSGKSTAVRH